MRESHKMKWVKSWSKWNFRFYSLARFKLRGFFYLNTTLNFGKLPVLVFQLEVCCKVDRLLTGITAQQKGTTARWYSNKTSIINIVLGSIKI